MASAHVLGIHITDVRMLETDPFLGLRTTGPFLGLKTTGPFLGLRTTDPSLSRYHTVPDQAWRRPHTRQTGDLAGAAPWHAVPGSRLALLPRMLS